MPKDLKAFTPKKLDQEIKALVNKLKKRKNLSKKEIEIATDLHAEYLKECQRRYTDPLFEIGRASCRERVCQYV